MTVTAVIDRTGETYKNELINRRTTVVVLPGVGGVPSLPLGSNLTCDAVRHDLVMLNVDVLEDCLRFAAQLGLRRSLLPFIALRRGEAVRPKDLVPVLDVTSC